MLSYVLSYYRADFPVDEGTCEGTSHGARKGGHYIEDLMVGIGGMLCLSMLYWPLSSALHIVKDSLDFHVTVKKRSLPHILTLNMLKIWYLATVVCFSILYDILLMYTCTYLLMIYYN